MNVAQSRFFFSLPRRWHPWPCSPPATPRRSLRYPASASAACPTSSSIPEARGGPPRRHRRAACSFSCCCVFSARRDTILGMCEKRWRGAPGTGGVTEKKNKKKNGGKCDLWNEWSAAEERGTDVCCTKCIADDAVCVCACASVVRMRGRGMTDDDDTTPRGVRRGEIISPQPKRKRM